MANEDIKQQIVDYLEEHGAVSASNATGLRDEMKIECPVTVFKRALGSLRYRAGRISWARSNVYEGPLFSDCRLHTVRLIAKTS